MAKFKKGDRVRVVKDSHEYADTGHLGTVAEIKEHIGVEMDAPFDGHGKSGRRWNFFKAAEELELADWDYDPRGKLKIQAGRYYKTRDGRKVGPVERREHDDDHPWLGCLNKPYNGISYGFVFNAGGLNYEYRDLDLIAEWVDEPAAESVAAESKPKFKVDDQVRYTKATPENFWMEAGMTGRIAKCWEDGSYGVIVDECCRGKNGNECQVCGEDSYLELIKPKASIFDSLIGRVVTAKLDVPQKPAIVALIENGQPLPSTRPFVHADRTGAATEAARLAAKHKGSEFGVYELVATKKEAVVYSHEWKRLAAAGRKDFAYSEFAKISGLSLPKARRAVIDWLDAA